MSNQMFFALLFIGVGLAALFIKFRNLALTAEREVSKLSQQLAKSELEKKKLAEILQMNENQYLK